MVKKFYFSLAMVLVLSFCSCSQTGAVRLGPVVASRVAFCPPAGVQVFASEADVPSGFERLAVVNVRGWQANTKWILSALKVRASAEGGDAIVLRAVKPKGLFTYSYGTGEALVIRLKAAGPAAIEKSPA